MKKLSRNKMLEELVNPKKGIFIKNKVFSAKEFISKVKLKDKVSDLVGDPRAGTKTDLLMLGAYTTLNTHLAKHGLHIKSRDYYSEFYVVGGPTAVGLCERGKVISSYKTKALNATCRGDNLILPLY